MHYFLKTLFFVAGVLLFFSYIAFSIPSRPSLPPEEGKINFAEVKTKDDLVSLGQKIFFGKGQCALCHSIGPSETARCPNLAGIGAKLSREFIYESLTQPSQYIYKQYEFSPAKPFAAQMPQINKPPIGLSENELLAVIAFVQSTGGREYVTVDPSELVKPAAQVLVASGDASKGQTIYKNLGCAKCHGIDGKKGEAGAPGLQLLAQKKDPLQLLSALQGGPPSKHQGFDARLTVKDLNDLMAYLAQFKAMPQPL
jgi:mono/diheme cytochrome c family protein